jgi:hypothetical protein
MRISNRFVQSELTLYRALCLRVTQRVHGFAARYWEGDTLVVAASAALRIELAADLRGRLGLCGQLQRHLKIRETRTTA